MNKKLLILLAFVIPFLTIGAGCATQKINEQTSVGNDTTTTVANVPSNWKVYQNTTYGFEIKYPAEAQGMKNLEISGQTAILSLILNNTKSLKIAPVNLANCYYSPFGGSVSQKTISSNGNSFCLNIEEDRGMGGNISRDYYYTIKNGNNYLLIDFQLFYNSNCGNFPEYTCTKFDETKETAIFNQILSTFKFTSPTVTTNTTVTFKNAKYGFSLELPTNWGEIKEEINTTTIFDTVRLTAENDPVRFIQIDIVKIENKNAFNAVWVKASSPVILTSNATYGYFYFGGGTYTGYPGQEDQKTIDIRNEVKAISKTLKLTGTITYEKFNAGDTGMSFDAPVGSEVFGNINGFNDIWKFVYNNNSYLIGYKEFRGGKASYAAWDGIMANHKVTIKKTTYSDVYTDGVVAHSESFFLALPNVSISVSKSEGTALIGEPSPNGDDVVYQHLIRSMTLDGIAAF